jgi:hypothetical protein
VALDDTITLTVHANEALATVQGTILDMTLSFTASNQDTQFVGTTAVKSIDSTVTVPFYLSPVSGGSFT